MPFGIPSLFYVQFLSDCLPDLVKASCKVVYGFKRPALLQLVGELDCAGGGNLLCLFLHPSYCGYRVRPAHCVPFPAFLLLSLSLGNGGVELVLAVASDPSHDIVLRHGIHPADGERLSLGEESALKTASYLLVVGRIDGKVLLHA